MWCDTRHVLGIPENYEGRNGTSKVLYQCLLSLARRWDPGLKSRINSEDYRRFREGWGRELHSEVGDTPCRLNCIPKPMLGFTEDWEPALQRGQVEGEP